MSEHECSGTDCASLVRIKALERTLEDEKKERSRSHEKIYNRLGALERGMTAVTTQYSQIIAQLATMSADINALKEKPNKRWETVITAIITGVVGFLLGQAWNGVKACQWPACGSRSVSDLRNEAGNPEGELGLIARENGG